MKKYLALTCLVVFVFLAGFYCGRLIPRRIPSTVAVRTSDLGLRIAYVDYCEAKSVIQFWLPCGLSGSETGEDFIYFLREVPRTGDVLTDIKSAITMLLDGPSSDEQARGAYSLIPGGRIRDIKFRDSKLTVNFSREFSPGGGSLAMKQVRIAVEEVARQFPEVESLEILVDGRADLLEP